MDVNNAQSARRTQGVGVTGAGANAVSSLLIFASFAACYALLGAVGIAPHAAAGILPPTLHL